MGLAGIDLRIWICLWDGEREQEGGKAAAKAATQRGGEGALSEQVLALGPAGGKEAGGWGGGRGRGRGGAVDPQSKHRLEGRIPARDP